MLGGSFLSAIGVLGGTLARVNPVFVFDELVVAHYFGGSREFASSVVRGLVQQGVAQSYKVCMATVRSCAVLDHLLFHDHLCMH